MKAVTHTHTNITNMCTQQTLLIQSHTQMTYSEIHVNTHVFLKIHKHNLSHIYTNTKNVTMHTQWTKTQVQNHTLLQELTQERRGPLFRGTHMYTSAHCRPTNPKPHTRTPPSISQSCVFRLHVQPQSLGLCSHTRAVTELFINLPRIPA